MAMSNLKERIGPKVGYNKSWIRPGYQGKHSPSKQSQTRNQISRAAGYESDQSSHEGDSGHRDRHLSHPGFGNSSRPARKTSLLERMGLSPGVDSGDDDEDTEAVAKSLIERVGLAGVETVHGTFSKARTPDNVEKDQESVKVPAPAMTLTTEALDALPLASDSENIGTAIANIPANGNADKDDHILSPRAYDIFQDHVHDGERFENNSVAGPSKRGNAVNSMPPCSSRNSTDPPRLEQSGNGNFSDSYSNDIDMLNTYSSRNATPLHSSSIEDGEVRDLETPEKVRELLAPLLLQNAAIRTSIAHDARPQPAPLDMDTLTDKVCSSFQGRVKDLRKSMDLSSIENRTNVFSVGAHSLVTPSSANDLPEQTGNTQKDVAPQPKASTSQFTTRREETSRSNAPLTYERDRATLRYTPSPQRHHRPRSSVGDNQSLQTDCLRNDRRSTSPPYHTSRRRSPSGERRHRLPPNAHEYHSPEPQSLREGRRSLSPSRQRRYRLPPNAHEYHSPEPQSLRSPSRQRRYRLPSNAHKYHSPEPQFLREGRRSLSPSRHTGRRRSPSGEYRHRLPSNAHEYHSPEPSSPHPRSPRRPRSPSSASRFFPDKFRRSPDSRSRSPYESARRRRGTLNTLEQGKGDYRGQRRRDNYPTRRSASPPPRTPYKPRSINRRGSFSPRHYSQSPDSPQISDQTLAGRYSTDRQPQAKKIPDDSISSRSMSISEPSSNNHKGLSGQLKPPGLVAGPPFYAQQNASGEIATAEHNLDILPCHHVPGLWFVKVALNDLGTLECSFDVDSETAIKWNFSRIGDDVKSDITDHTLSLHICCFATELVEEIYRSLQHNATPEDIASAIFSLKTEWPTQGHLIIAVNPQNEKDCAKQVFLPEKLGPMNSPICINDLVHQGQNVVQFIQLSSMAGKVFALCATRKQNDKPDDVTCASKEDNTSGTHGSVVKVLPLE